MARQLRLAHTNTSKDTKKAGVPTTLCGRNPSSPGLQPQKDPRRHPLPARHTGTTIPRHFRIFPSGVHPWPLCHVQVTRYQSHCLFSHNLEQLLQAQLRPPAGPHPVHLRSLEKVVLDLSSLMVDQSARRLWRPPLRTHRRNTILEVARRSTSSPSGPTPHGFASMALPLTRDVNPTTRASPEIAQDNQR